MNHKTSYRGKGNIKSPNRLQRQKIKVEIPVR